MVRLPDEVQKRLIRHIEAYPALSDRALSRAVGVTPTSVGRWRRKLNSPQIPGPRMPEVERLTLALARQYPQADVDALSSTLDPRFRRSRARTLRLMADWLGRYADALDPSSSATRRVHSPPSEAFNVNQDRGDLDV